MNSIALIPETFELSQHLYYVLVKADGFYAMANPHFAKFVEVASASKDSVSFRPQVKLAYKYFIGYNIFVKKDYKVAIEFCDKILAIDPTDAEATEYKRQLTGNKSQATGNGNSCSFLPSTAATPPFALMIRFTARAILSSSTPTAMMLCESWPTEEAMAPRFIPTFLMKATAGSAFS